MALINLEAGEWCSIEEWIEQLASARGFRARLGVFCPTMTIFQSIRRKAAVPEYVHVGFFPLTPRSDIQLRGNRVDGWLIHPHVLALEPYRYLGSDWKRVCAMSVLPALADPSPTMLKYRLAVLDLRYQNCLPTDWIL